MDGAADRAVYGAADRAVYDIAGLLFGGDDAAVRAARVAVLRGQRMQLHALIDELGVAMAQLRNDDPGGCDRTWRSHAGRLYAARRDELQLELDRAVALVHNALASVEWAIAELLAAP